MLFASAVAVLCCRTMPWSPRLRISKNSPDLGGAMGIRTPDLLHAMQVRQPACQQHHRPLPADPVHRRARECLPVAGCWLSTRLSTISLDHDLFECLEARCTAHAGNAERCSRGKNTAATVIGDVAGVSRSVTRDRFADTSAPAGRGSPPATARSPAGAARARGAANDSTHMAAITQIRHRHSEGRPAKIIRAVPPAPEAAVLRLLSLSDSPARPGRTPWPTGPGENPPNLLSQASAQLTSTQRDETAGRRNAEPVPNAESVSVEAIARELASALRNP